MKFQTKTTFDKVVFIILVLKNFMWQKLLQQIESLNSY